MAVYVISDVHGALRKLRELLLKIEFRPDRGDVIYFLGDYCDWGEESIETILFLMDAVERFPSVHCLMGNHEKMFLEALLAERNGKAVSEETMYNWLVINRGRVTMEGYRKLPEETKQKVFRFLAGLPYCASVTAGGLNYLLAHAYPFYEDIDYPPEERDRRRTDALWRRLFLREDPFAEYTGTHRYDVFVCGHTITSWYNTMLSREIGLEMRARVEGEVLGNRVFYGKNFIDIDCGAKLFPLRGKGGSREADHAQLACLRLDDRREFYVRYMPVPEEVETQKERLRTAVRDIRKGVEALR